MKRIAFLALLALGACSSLSTTVSTVKAQQAVDLAVAAYKVDLDAENIYLAQAPCGPKNLPPLCASYAVGVLWKAADQKVKAAIIDTQVKIDALGSDPKVIDAAVADMQLALAQLNTFTVTYKAK